MNQITQIFLEGGSPTLRIITPLRNTPIRLILQEYYFH